MFQRKALGYNIGIDVGGSYMSEYLPGNLCERLRELREARKLGLNDVADIIHVSRPTYSRIEKGEASISGEAIIELAKFYDVPTDYILGMVDTPEKTYYELQELGISVEAAKNLYSGKVDPRVINELLVNDKFASAVRMMSVYYSGIMSDILKAGNDVKDFSYGILDELLKTGELPKDEDTINLKKGIVLSKTSENQYELEKIRNYMMAAIKEVKEKIDLEVQGIKEERQTLSKEVAAKVKLEVNKIKWGRKLPKEQRIKEFTKAINSGVALDPNISEETMEFIAPRIAEIAEALAEGYGKKNT